MVQTVKEFLVSLFRGIVKPPTWLVLKRRLDSRLLRTSYFWIVFVPIAARVVGSLPATVEAHLLSKMFIFNLDLPFSWQIFYWSSMFFAAASLLYSSKCPEVIRDFDKFSDFASEGRGKASLEHYLNVLDSGYSERKDIDAPKDLVGLILELKAEGEMSPDRKGDIFHRAQQLYNYGLEKYRRGGHLLWILGVSLSIVLLIQNAISVVGMMFR